MNYRWSVLLLFVGDIQVPLFIEAEPFWLAVQGFGEFVDVQDITVGINDK